MIDNVDRYFSLTAEIIFVLRVFVKNKHIQEKTQR